MEKQCMLVRAGTAAEGTTGLTYASGISAGTAGTRSLCLELATLPPGARGRAHFHPGHESAAYILEARTDPEEQESAVPLPALDSLPHLDAFDSR